MPENNDQWFCVESVLHCLDTGEKHVDEPETSWNSSGLFNFSSLEIQDYTIQGHA